MRRLLVASLLLVACVEHEPSPIRGVSTLNVNLKSPDPGLPSAPTTSLDAVIDVSAFLDDGTPFPGTADVDVFLSYGGVLTGMVTNCGDTTKTPIAHFSFDGGSITDQHITLPPAYGTSAIWVEETNSHVAGSSVPMYYPNPTIPQIMTPPDPLAANATFCTPFDRKFIIVDHATNGGELLVDSLFQGALTVIDTGALETGYSAMYVFTFGAPASDIRKGSKIRMFSGNVSKFVGFTEVNFPVLLADDSLPPDPSKLPAPIVLQQTDTANVQKLNAIDARTVQFTGLICPMVIPNPNNDSMIQSTNNQWVKYNTFVAGATNCSSISNFSVQLPTKAVLRHNPDGSSDVFDPTKVVGSSVTVNGMLKNSSGQNKDVDANGDPLTCSASTPCANANDTCLNNICYKGPYNFWTIVLRDGDDLVNFTPPP